MTFAKPIVPSELELSTFSLLELEEDCVFSLDEETTELDEDFGVSEELEDFAELELSTFTLLEEDFGASLDELWAILLEDGYSTTSPLLPL
jgi:hypothetical protein